MPSTLHRARPPKQLSEDRRKARVLRLDLVFSAGRWTILRRVTLPLIRPGLFAGCTLVLIWSFTELGTPLIFQFYNITPVQVFKLVLEPDSRLPYALVVVMLLASAVLYLIGKVLLGRGFESATTKASIGTGTP